MSKVKALQPIIRSLAFDRRRWLPLEASRSTFGVALTIIVSLIYHNPGAGALASIGALYTGMAASSGVYHARARTMAVSGLMIALATMIGAFVGNSEIASLISVAIVAFITALYATSSRSAGTIGAQTTALLCVVIGLHLPPAGALDDGLIVLAGSAVQFFLLTAIWPMKEGFAERNAVAETFEALAQFVLELPKHRDSDSPQIPPSAQIQEARDLLSEAERLHWHLEHDQLFQALRRAEALRAALVGFAQADRNFAATDRASQVRADRILRSVARSLRAIATRTRQGRLLGARVEVNIPVLPAESEAAVHYQSWLKMVVDLVADTCCPDMELPAREQPRQTKLRSLFTALTLLPDIAAVRSVVLQHAIRYAITVEVAFAISEHWTRSHSYWLPVTVALVLRQDYGPTFQRGIGRIAGTLAGLAVADLLLFAGHPGVIVLQVLTLIATWFAMASVQASYAIASAAVTGFVVFSISSSGVVSGDISSMRLVASLIGVALAVISYVLWPAWHWSQVWETYRKTAEAQFAYCEKVIKLHSERQRGGKQNAEIELELDESRSEARALRIQTENLLEAIKVHPKGFDKRLIKIASDSSQLLEENAATILVSEAAWKGNRPDTDDHLQAVILGLRNLISFLSGPIEKLHLSETGAKDPLN